MEFDPKVWTERAEARRQNALGAGAREKTDIEEKYADDIRMIQAIHVVVEWCAARSLSVDFVKKSGGFYHPVDKKITLSGRAAPRRQLYLLLHECGHCLIGDDKLKHERYGMGYPMIDEPGVNRSLHHRLDILEEEFEAWHRGWRLALRLKILDESDKPGFDELRTKFLLTYVRWVK